MCGLLGNLLSSTPSCTRPYYRYRWILTCTSIRQSESYWSLKTTVVSQFCKYKPKVVFLQTKIIVLKSSPGFRYVVSRFYTYVFLYNIIAPESFRYKDFFFYRVYVSRHCNSMPWTVCHRFYDPRVRVPINEVLWAVDFYVLE